ncbi:MAG: hypothetical protein K2O78_01165 [Muribaculaceae bacterium]|nr:hypothetical protein [Muribaculaceae bacterium]
MNTGSIINVNPSEAPAGSRNPELTRFMLRRRLLRQGAMMARRAAGVQMLHRLFGATSVSIAVSVLLLMVRIGVGVWLVLEGVSAPSVAGCVGLILAGIAVASGFLCRLLMSAGAICAGSWALYGLTLGFADMVPFVMVAGFVLLALSGPGSYSLDSLMNSRIFRAVKRRKTRLLLQKRFSFAVRNMRRPS